MTIYLVTLLVLIVLKLTHTIEWSWLKVFFFPFVIIFLLFVGALVFYGVAAGGFIALLGLASLGGH